MMNRRSYPLHEDLKQAIIEISSKGINEPFELCKEVNILLKRKGYYTGHVNVIRVWKIYEQLQKENDKYLK